MDKRFLGTAGAASFDVFHHDQMSDETFIETVQDIEPILELNKAEYNDAPSHFRTDDGTTFRHVGRIPDVIVARLMRDGIWGDPAALKKFLNDPDNRLFRTHPGTI